MVLLRAGVAGYVIRQDLAGAVVCITSSVTRLRDIQDLTSGARDAVIALCAGLVMTAVMVGSEFISECGVSTVTQLGQVKTFIPTFVATLGIVTVIKQVRMCYNTSFF